MGAAHSVEMVKNCLEDEACEEVKREGQMVLETVQDGMSESERSERMGVRAKTYPPRHISEKGPPADPKIGRERRLGPRPVSPDRGSDSWWEPVARPRFKTGLIYPTQELAALRVSTPRDSSEEEDERLDAEEEADLEEEAAQYEGERYHPDERWHRNLATNRAPRSGPEPRAQVKASPRPASVAPTAPSAPPPYETRPKAVSRLTDKVRHQLSLAFPVFESPDDARVYAPVEFNQLKKIAKSVREYGPNANFTIMQLEQLALNALTPADWQTIAKAALPSMGQYMEWKALWHEAVQSQARANASALKAEQRDWSFDLLTRQGCFSADQANYPWGAYAQVFGTAIRAWKALNKKEEGGNQLTKILQGPQEPFSDYVARMMDAAGKIFGDPDAVGPFLEQLIYEQASQECKNAIAPRKNKGLQDWLRICRDIGSPLSNTGLAAAILQAQRRPPPTGRERTCFNCKRPGHLARDCQEPKKECKAPTLCSRCQKVYHTTNQCRSVRDLRGNLLLPLQNSANEEPKNGPVGPRFRGPQKYGTPFVKAQSLSKGSPQLDTQEWTCVPPPQSY